VDAVFREVGCELSSQLITDVALRMSVSGSQVNPRVPARVSRGSAKARVEPIRFARSSGLNWGEWVAFDGSGFAWWLGWSDEIAATVAYLSGGLAAYASGTFLQVDGEVSVGCSVLRSTSKRAPAVMNQIRRSR
jgi:hypothetical protein